MKRTLFVLALLVSSAVGQGWIDELGGCDGEKECRVVVPPGRWSVPSPLVLRSHTLLELAPGAA